jgi:hypothetical protein
MADEIKLTWNGEKITQKVAIKDQEITAKQMIETLAHARNQVNQMNEQRNKLGDNLVKLEKDIRSAGDFVKQREEFEEKCNELQIAKLKLLIAGCSEECKKKAVIDADKIIAKDPSAYTEDQKVNMKYVNYQRLLATNDKIANKIAQQIIQQDLFAAPIFDNPFI